jgi:hypothetical protein
VRVHDVPPTRDAVLLFEALAKMESKDAHAADTAV